MARRIDSCEKVIKPGRRAQRGPEQRNAIFCHCSPSRQRNRLFFSSSLFSSFFSFFFLFLPTLCNRWRTTRERARFNIFNGKRRYNKSGFRAVCCPARGLFNEKQRVTKNLQGNGADIFLGQMPIDYRFYSPLNGRNAQLFRGFPRFRSFNFFSTHDFSSFFDSLPVKKGILLFLGCVFSLRTLLRGNFFQIYHRIPIVFPREFGIIVFHHFLMPPFSPIRATFFL